MSYAERDEFCNLLSAERRVSARSIQDLIQTMANAAVQRRGAIGSPDWLRKLGTILDEQTVSMRKNSNI